MNCQGAATWWSEQCASHAAKRHGPEGEGYLMLNVLRHVNEDRSKKVILDAEDLSS